MDYNEIVLTSKWYSRCIDAFYLERIQPYIDKREKLEKKYLRQLMNCIIS